MTVKPDVPNLVNEPDRYGNDRLYVRVKIGRRVRRARIKEAPGTPEFLSACADALQRLKAGASGKASGSGKAAAATGSLGWLAAEYFASPVFQKLDATSQTNRRRIIDGCLAEPVEPGTKHVMRDCPFLRVDATHIIMLRDRKAKKPGAANNRLKYLSALFGWAINAKQYKIPHNPCRDVKKVEYASDGYYTWTVEDVIKYVEKHPVGTQANLALSLMLFLGARRGDAVTLGPKNVQVVTDIGADGRKIDQRVMTYVPRKTSYKRKEASVKPILPPLAEAIRRTPVGLKTFLVTSFGKPYADAGFGNKMREWCDAAELPECSSHGLKKAAATICANLGATDRQLMALFDWTSEAQANAYTRKANKTKLAAECAKLLGQFFASDEARTAGATA